MVERSALNPNISTASTGAAKQEAAEYVIEEGSTRDVLGETWHLGKQETLEGVPRIIFQALERDFGETGSLKVLDLGCYDGNLPKFIRKNHGQSFSSYMGVDIDSDAIARACQDSSLPDESFEVGNIFESGWPQGLPRDNNAIICTGVMHNENKASLLVLLKGIKELLSEKPNSRVYLFLSTHSEPESAAESMVDIIIEDSNRNKGIKTTGYLLDHPEKPKVKYRGHAYDRNELDAVIQDAGLKIDTERTQSFPIGLGVSQTLYVLQN